jgi:UDP-N-acetylmuramoyl-L-alanyl-D-glutamate--2,6-diaminopimelate ligase
VGLGGSFNVDNAIAAATVAGLLGCAAGDIAAGLGSMSAVPGRFEAVDAGQDFGVVVDYAHTPDGLTAVLAAAREVTGSHRVIVVFGCGGDRDATKRPLMGRAAVDNADAVVITSDNPRGEDPDAIIAAIRSGIPATMVDVVTVEPDRRAAIGIALAMATPGDLVVIAGKGHETTQTVGTTVSQFDDRAVARELLGPVES